MYKTIEEEVLKKAAPTELEAEFLQHEFERLHTFCVLIYIASIVVWIAYDLILSFIGGQPFTWRSLMFFGAFTILVIILLFIRDARHFQKLNLLFVLSIAFGTRLLTEGLANDHQPAWLLLAASTTLFTASVLPLSRWSFFAAQGVTWWFLNPFYNTGIEHFELGGVMAVVPLAAESVPGGPLAAFERLAEVASAVRATHPGAVMISAGMSADLEDAITAGATHVRVGTALLGGRPGLVG